MIDWRHWHNEPYLVGGLIFLGWAYALLVGPFRARMAPGEPFPRQHVLRFYAALVCFYLAVGSPLDQIGERLLFSAHMLQHQLLVYPAAMLFLLGLPTWLIDRALTGSITRFLVRLLTHPLVAGTIYTLVISVWHFPRFYDWALQDKIVHVIEHVTFFAAAVLYWWPILSPSQVVPRARPGIQIIYILAVVITMTPVAAYLVFTPHVLYPTYEFAPRIIANFTPMDDQLLAGAMMKLGGLAVALATLIWCFYELAKERPRERSRPPVPV